uniref:Uncharacterized protein n=1 Tax=viral metagenome TaxID=1070528 RepID=A0A6M3L3E0_9ZZZZ
MNERSLIERTAKIEQKLDDMNEIMTNKLNKISTEVSVITDKIVRDFKEIALLKQKYEDCPARQYVKFPNMSQITIAIVGLISSVVGGIIAWAVPKILRGGG